MKNQYDRFRVRVVVDDICFGIHSWDAGDRYETRYFLPIKFVNNSNSIGLISNMRIKVKYHFWGPIWLSEYYSCDYELYNRKSEGFTYDARGESLEQIVKRDFTPIVLKQHQIYESHFMFRCFWDETRIIPDYNVYFQTRSNNSRWKNRGKWKGHLTKESYDLFIANQSTMPLMKWPSFLSNVKLLNKWGNYSSKKIHTLYSKKVELERYVIEPSTSEW
jgi:hypothetical protein